MKTWLAVAATTLLGTTAVMAAESSIGVRGSTLGFGAEYSYKLYDNLNLRVNTNGFTYSHSDTQSDIDYDADLKLFTAGLLADIHPFENGFRLSAGAYYNGNKIDMTAEPSDGSTYDINGVSYSTTDVGSLDAQLKFDSFAPYLGLGYDASLFKDGSFFFLAEIGVLYQGSPKVSMNVQCGAALTPAQCEQLRSDVASEQAQLSDDVKDYKWWPVLSLGLAYHF